MLGLCEAENGTEIDVLLQAEASMARGWNELLPKRPNIGRLKGKRGESPGRQIRVGRIDGTKKGCGVLREKELQERGAMPEEEGDVIREYNAMHEENFLSNWLRKDLAGKEERRRKVNETVRQDVEYKRKREEERKRDGEKEENETVRAK